MVLNWSWGPKKWSNGPKIDLYPKTVSFSRTIWAQKKRIHVPFEERGTPHQRDPPLLKKSGPLRATLVLVDQVRIHRVPIAIRPRSIAIEVCAYMLPSFSTRLDRELILKDLSCSNKSSNDASYRRNIVTHVQCLPAPVPTRIAALRTRDTPIRSFQPA